MNISILNSDVVSDLVVYYNSLIVLSELFINLFLLKWVMQRHSAAIHYAVFSWFLVSIGYFFRIGYWAFASFYGGDPYIWCSLEMECVQKNATYPAWAIQNRAWLLIPSLMIVAGNVLFVRYIEGFTKYVTMSIFMLLFLIAIVPAVLN